MTKLDSLPAPTAGEPPTPHRRRTVLLVIAAVVVLALVVTGLVLAGMRGAAGGAGQPQGEPAAPVPGASDSPPPPSATPSAGSTPAAPKVDPRFGSAVGATAAQDVPVTTSTGLTAVVGPVKSVTAKAVRVGEVAGPALSVTVKLTNPGSSAISLDQVRVNGYYGKAATPAAPITTGTAALSGALAAGASATGTYVFSVPENGQSSAVFTLSDAAGTPVTVIK